MARPKQDLIKALKRWLPLNSKLLIAVSGGLDSVCLLRGCCELSREYNLSLEIAHVNHGLRLEASQDATFVSELAAKYKLPFHLKEGEKVPVKANVEEWGRRLRYSFFKETLIGRKLDYVLTAHTANDVAETLLMRLIANKELNSIERFSKQRLCIRPLLSVSRDELLLYANEHKLSYVEDRSNSDLSYQRNRVRHKLIPLLKEEFDPRIVEVLSQRGLALADDNRALSKFIKADYIALKELEFGSKAWLGRFKSALKELSPDLGWRLVEKVFKNKLGFNLGRVKSQRVVEFIKESRLAIELPTGIRLQRKAGGISLVRV